MAKTRINKSVYERCLLTEITPFETPLLFSNWGSFNYEYRLKNTGLKMLDKLFTPSKSVIPYSYVINKDLTDYRTLHVPHPAISKLVVELYRNWDVLIPKTCSKSSFSIRAPHNIAKWFLLEKGKKSIDNYVEQIDENRAFASSYFVYKHFSHLYKFFESKQFSSLENRFSTMVRLDISKFFPSIYTHSIAWAMRGKNEAKRLLFLNRNDDGSFPSFFDTLMQRINHIETNGIVIGPELSRIFAEIILQSVDFSVERALKEEHNLIHNVDYFCCRYIDDFYLFYNNDSIIQIFERTLKIVLEKYKLYLNPAKREVIKRPFTTNASLLKIELSKYLSDLTSRIRIMKVIKPEKELNRLRAIIGVQKESLNKVTSFFLGAMNSAFKRSVKGIQDNDYLINIYLLFFELALHWYKLDMRVSGSYKIVELTNEITRRLRNLSPDSISRVKSTLYFELADALDIACDRKSIIESLNLLICLKSLGIGFEVPDGMVQKIISSSRVRSSDDPAPRFRNTYFDIVTLLYYVESNPLYEESKQILLEQAKEIIKNNDIRKYSESMMLFLDLISCPYIDRDFKKEIIYEVAVSLNASKKDSDINFSLKRISSYSWYFNWFHGSDIRNLLKKKQLMLSY